MPQLSRFHRLLTLLLALTFTFGGLLALTTTAPVVAAGGGLTVTIGAAYNLVVDSNVSSPSTYAPRVATVTGTFCNTTDAPMTDVYGYIGDYKGGTNSTPGIYPAKEDPIIGGFEYLGIYAFEHVGGANPVADASRYIGTLAPGECKVQYWHFTYPTCTNDNSGGAFATPCTGDSTPTYGPSVKPDDDLSLDFHIWGRASSGSVTHTGHASRAMTMRSQISAMANKIEPNGAMAGEWFNTTAPVSVGDIITTNGVLYSLGNVRFGFDNDGDFVPDYNAWLQPISQVDYDPSCFRLLGSSGVLTVTRGGGNPPMIINFTDQLYFTNLPSDNTNVRGEVYYRFIALNGPCNVSLSPYQEVASGFDNEKFNGDYGTGIPPIISLAPKVTIDKSSAPDTIALGHTTTYRIPFANTGTADAGLNLSTGGYAEMPLTISDAVPHGMQLAEAADYYLNGSGTVNIRYSTNSGATWSTTAPVGEPSIWPNNKIIIHWSLDQPLPKNSTGNYAELEATVPSSGYSGPSFIENTACIGLGDAAPFACASDLLKVRGDQTLSGTVFKDNGPTGSNFRNGTYQSADEGTIGGVTVSLYISTTHGYLLWDTTTSSSTPDDGSYSFEQLPNGEYKIVGSTDLPGTEYIGWTESTPTSLFVELTGSGSSGHNFGFAPTLSLSKRLIGGVGYENRNVQYIIELTNLIPGGGTPVGENACEYIFWADAYDAANSGTGNAAWENPANALGEPSDSYARARLVANTDDAAFQAQNVEEQNGTITAVDLLIPLYKEAGAAGTLQVNIITTAGGGLLQTGTVVNLTTINNGTYVIPVNIGSIGWNWTHFAARSIELLSKKSGNPPGGIRFYGIGYRVTTNAPCVTLEARDIISTVPLTDTFDTSLLTFVSATPPHTAVHTTTTTGVITWTNVGPIYPGQTRSVIVNFIGKDPAPATSKPLYNTAATTDPRFADGRLANSDVDTATGTLYATAEITGVVYSDPNSSGWNYNPNDPDRDFGIPNVTVELLACVNQTTGNLVAVPAPSAGQKCETGTSHNDGKWEVIATVTTNANGHYEFKGVLLGWYRVRVVESTLPGSYTRTGEAGTTSTSGGAHERQTMNGDQAAGRGCLSSNPACDDTWGDTGENLSTTYYNPIDTPNEVIGGVNFGYNIQPVVYGTIWHDFNGDGVRDPGEDGLDNVTAGITVTLRNAFTGTVVATTQTNANGYYRFTGLTAGTTYTIEVNMATLPNGSGWTNTSDFGPGTDNDDKDSQLRTITLAAGQISGSYDFGYHQTGSHQITGKVYADWNDNADWDTGEPGFEGVTVTLYSPTGAVISTTTSTPDGSYTFKNLPKGDYTVVVDRSTISDQYTQSEDPDSTRDNRTTVVINGGNQTGVDFGYKPNGTGIIGDTVWRDMNGDGVQAGPGETGIAGVYVWLEVTYDAGITWSRVVTATTGSDGKYLFENLPDGAYRVIVNVADDSIPQGPGGFAYQPSTWVTQTVTIDNGSVIEINGDACTACDRDVDFGFTPLGVIGDMIYYDANANREQDLYETGIPGVEVRLYNNTTETLRMSDKDVAPGGYISTTTVSDPNSEYPLGWYQFAGLPTGSATSPYTYKVHVITETLPSGITLQTADPDRDGVPCDVIDPNYTACDSKTTVLVFPGTVFLGADFGYKPNGVIGDYIWIDTNGDGVQDPDEQGLGFVKVELYKSDESNWVLHATTFTDFEGFYSFAHLETGTYEVRVDTGTLPTGLAPTYDRDGSTSPNVVTNVGIDSTGKVTSIGSDLCSDCNLEFDFGYRYFDEDGYSISGTVFFDVSKDTEFGDTYVPYDPNHPDTTDYPYANITVYLWRDGKIIAETTTNSSGYYSFANLPDGGSYTVSVDRSGNLGMMALTATPNYTAEPHEIKSFNTTTNLKSHVINQDFGFHAIMDMGDLPNSYNFGSGDVTTIYTTRFAYEGPMHINNSGNLKPTIYLGAHWDAEPDGQPDVDAGMGDSGGDRGDEDGVEFVGSWSPGITVTLRITITDTDPDYTPYLVGWFDWNQDGRFTGDNEMVRFGNLISGTHEIDLRIPQQAKLGRIYMRFRLYATESPPLVISPIGAVINGEVEDYYQTNTTPTAVTLSRFAAHGAPRLSLPVSGALLALALALVGGRRKSRRRIGL